MRDPNHSPTTSFPTASPTKIHEPVRVAVDFQGTKVRPLAFVWGHRKYIVERVNLVYKRRVGDHVHWCFAVSDAANSYVLVYDAAELRWMLEEVYAR